MNNQQPKIWDVLDEVKGLPSKVGEVTTTLTDLAQVTKDGFDNTAKATNEGFDKLTRATNDGFDNLNRKLDEIRDAIRMLGQQPPDEILINLCCLCLLADKNGQWQAPGSQVRDALKGHRFVNLEAVSKMPDADFEAHILQLRQSVAGQPDLEQLFTPDTLRLIRRLGQQIAPKIAAIR